jgi:hypothetical protein
LFLAVIIVAFIFMSFVFAKEEEERRRRDCTIHTHGNASLVKNDGKND